MAALFPLAGCDRDPEEGQAPYAGIKPAQAIRDLQNPESLRSIEFPEGASLIAIREEGLRVYMVFDMPEKDRATFMGQLFLKDLSQRSSGDFPAPENTEKPSWWHPDVDVITRYSGIIPQNRAIKFSFNKLLDANTVRVYMVRSNL